MIVLVVGAGGTLGREVCAHFLDAGWSVVAFSRHPDRVHQAVGTERIRVCEADCEDPTSLGRAFAASAREAAGCRGAVNCAGITIRKPLQELSLGEFRRVQAINVEATLIAMQYEYELLKENGGVIVNVGSLASLHANRWQESAYVAAKHSLFGLTKAAAMEFGSANVRVNLVAPSVFGGMAKGERDASTFVELPTVEALAEKAPLKRLPQVAEIARVVAWLIRDCPACITGIALPIDAGLSCT